MSVGDEADASEHHGVSPRARLIEAAADTARRRFGAAAVMPATLATRRTP
ncbi:hypothetical protein ABZU25_28370 [Micromonospora sp. NPDC005215]